MSRADKVLSKVREATKIFRGDSVHNSKLNKTGTVMAVKGTTLEVKMPSGSDTWDIKDVELIPEYD